MADSYTDSLRVVQQVDTENAGTWGTKVDAALQVLEDSVADVRSITQNSTSITLSIANNADDQSRAAVLDFDGSPTGTCTVTVPDKDKVYIVNNGTDESLLFTKGSGTTYTMTAGMKALLYVKGGTGVFAVYDGKINDIGELTATNSNMIVGDGTTWVAESGTTLRTSIGAMAQGKHTIWIPAGAMRPTVSAGCAALTDAETTAGSPDMQVLDFDGGSSDEHAQFQIAFPKSWNESTLTYQVFWTSTATDTDGVAWALQAIGIANDGTIDSAFSGGTPVVVTDDNISAAEDLLVTPVSGNVTVANAAVDTVTYFRIFRDVSDGNDDMAEDARLIGIKLFYTIDAEDDS